MARSCYYLAAFAFFLVLVLAESSPPCSATATLQTITEASIFLLFANTSIDSPTLHSHLATAARNCEAFTAENSGNADARFTWYHSLQPDTPDLIYYIGSWASVREHLIDFVGSPIGRETVGLLASALDPAHLMHWAIDQADCNNRAIETADRLFVIRGFAKDDGQIGRLLGGGGDGDGQDDCDPSGSVTVARRIDPNADDNEFIGLVRLDSSQSGQDAKVLAASPSWGGLTNVTVQILQRIDV